MAACRARKSSLQLLPTSPWGWARLRVGPHLRMLLTEGKVNSSARGLDTGVGDREDRQREGWDAAAGQSPCSQSGQGDASFTQNHFKIKRKVTRQEGDFSVCPYPAPLRLLSYVIGPGLCLWDRAGRLFYRMSPNLGLSDFFSQLDGGCDFRQKHERSEVPLPVCPFRGTHVTLGGLSDVHCAGVWVSFGAATDF